MQTGWHSTLKLREKEEKCGALPQQFFACSASLEELVLAAGFAKSREKFIAFGTIVLLGDYSGLLPENLQKRH